MVEQPITREPDATRAAFRAGVKGMRYTEHPDPAFDLPVMTDAPQGPNERHFETIERLPALSDPEAAYEAGRALRVPARNDERLDAQSGLFSGAR